LAQFYRQFRRHPSIGRARLPCKSGMARQTARLYFPRSGTYIGAWTEPAKGRRARGNAGPRSMLNDIYNKRIIELAGNIPRLGRLSDPDASATAHSKLCGSTVKVDLKMEGPIVTDFAHDVKACALGQAFSSDRKSTR